LDMPAKVEGGNIIIVDVKKKNEEILSVAAANPSEVLVDTKDEIVRRVYSRFSLAGLYQSVLGTVPDIYLSPITALDESIAAGVDAMCQSAANVLLETTERANAEDNMELFNEIYSRSEAFLEILGVYITATSNRIINNTGVMPVANPEHIAMALGVAPLAVKTDEVEVAPSSQPQQTVIPPQQQVQT